MFTVRLKSGPGLWAWDYARSTSHQELNNHFTKQKQCLDRMAHSMRSNNVEVFSRNQSANRSLWSSHQESKGSNPGPGVELGRFSSNDPLIVMGRAEAALVQRRKRQSRRCRRRCCCRCCWRRRCRCCCESGGVGENWRSLMWTGWSEPYFQPNWFHEKWRLFRSVGNRLVRFSIKLFTQSWCFATRMTCTWDFF